MLTEEGAEAEVAEFLRAFAGPKSEFYFSAAKGAAYRGYDKLVSLLEAFRDYVSAGLLEAVSPERQAQLDVVNDLMEQSAMLLDSKEVHPGAAAMLIGATLEEFLRTWVNQLGLSLAGRKPSIQAYTDILRDAGHVGKQDVKDLTAWAGLRNHAAHGEWDQVNNRERIRVMLDGVNLFLRQTGV